MRFRRNRRTAEWHMIDSGRVGCPVRGDIDVEQCLMCASIEDLTSEDGQGYVVCRPTLISQYLLRPEGIPGFRI